MRNVPHPTITTRRSLLLSTAALLVTTADAPADGHLRRAGNTRGRHHHYEAIARLLAPLTNRRAEDIDPS